MSPEMETEQRGTAYLGLFSADGSPATPDTKLEDLHHSSKTMLSNLPEYRFGFSLDQYSLMVDDVLVFLSGFYCLIS